MNTDISLLFQNVLKNGIREMVFIINVDEAAQFHYAFLNEAAKEQTKLTEDVIGRTFHDVYPVKIADHLASQYRKVLDTEESVTYEDSYESPAGIKYSETTLTPLFENGRCSHITAFVKDITRHKLNEFKLRNSRHELDRNKQKYRESEDQLRIITDNSNDLITMINQDGYIDYVSPSYKNVLDHDPDDYINKHFLYNVHEDDTERLLDSFADSVKTQTTWQDQFRQKNRAGQYIWSELRGSPVYDEEDAFTHMVVVSRNITVRKDYELQLQHMAYHDPLTGLPNRRYFMEQLSKQIDAIKGTKRRMAIMMLDLDQFKTINDRLGHDIGDKAIREFGHRVNRIIRDNDMLARLGGDEFTLMLPNVSARDDVIQVADRIQQAVNETWCIEDHAFSTTTSLGIVISSPCSPELPNTLLKYVDNQLYKAKQSGKNNYQIYDFTNDESI
ncbi:diguanylate cyclase domain-containing protein [Lentibacillus salinarum]|uniref:Diguanylate cyclase domain-containing protein n=1 Tax=Lentibacillus salinarum TaxID=446820 RepID=A0ABW3ZU48_9BACI